MSYLCVFSEDPSLEEPGLDGPGSIDGPGIEGGPGSIDRPDSLEGPGLEAPGFEDPGSVGPDLAVTGLLEGPDLAAFKASSSPSSSFSVRSSYFLRLGGPGLFGSPMLKTKLSE